MWTGEFDIAKKKGDIRDEKMCDKWSEKRTIKLRKKKWEKKRQVKLQFKVVVVLLIRHVIEDDHGDSEDENDWKNEDLMEDKSE